MAEAGSIRHQQAHCRHTRRDVRLAARGLMCVFPQQMTTRHLLSWSIVLSLPPACSRAPIALPQPVTRGLMANDKLRHPQAELD